MLEEEFEAFPNPEGNFVRDFLGSPLFSKLKLRYWELAHVRETPLAIAR